MNERVASPVRAWRLFAVVVHLLVAAVLALRLPSVDRTMRSTGGRARDRVGWWHRRLCRILGVSIVVHGRPHPEAALLVANHISWLDIVGLNAVCDALFLAKREIRDWPLLGWLSARAGTLFIRRGAEDGARQAADQITWHLLRGNSVVLFPEGTSTDGRSVRRFHARLFQSAVRAGCMVQPVAVRYPHVEGCHPLVPFVGEDAFAGHLWRLLSLRGIRLELTFLPPLEPREHTRQALATRSQQGILAVVNTATPADATTARPASG